MTPPLWQKEKRNRRASWWKWKRRVKIWLKTQHSENEDHGIWSHHFMANRWGNRGNSERLYFLGFQLTADGDCSHEIKRRLLLGRKVMTILCSVAQLCPTLCDPMDCSTPGLPVSPSISQEVMGPDAMIFVFWMLSLSQLFHSPLSLSRGFLVTLHFLP